MTDIQDGGAPAGGTSAAVIDPNPVNAPAPISSTPQAPGNEPQANGQDSQADTAEQPKQKPVSVRDAVRNAREKIEAEEKAEREGRERDGVNRRRGDNGAQSPKDQALQGQPAQQAGQQSRQQSDQPSDESSRPRSSFRDAPGRFSSDAKAAWETAPEPVKAEIHRAIRELEDGQQKYRQSHERYERIRQFDEIAAGNGGDLRQSLEKVVALEQAFARSPVEGMQRICDHFGINMRALAAHVMGQTPDQVQMHQDQTITGLRHEIESLRQQLGGVVDGFHEQRVAAVSRDVEAFAADNPRFYDVMDDVAFFLTSGRIDPNLPQMERLSEAYRLAERLNPPLQSPSLHTPPLRPAPDLRAQTAKGSKSVSGAPSGSNPDAGAKTETVSIKEAIRRARAQASSL